MTVQRPVLAAIACGLLALAAFRLEPLAGGQAARSYSLPGQEDLSFWANHRGQTAVKAEIRGVASMEAQSNRASAYLLRVREAETAHRRRQVIELFQKARDRYAAPAG